MIKHICGVSACLVAGFFCLGALQAGTLTIQNDSNNQISCTANSETKTADAHKVLEFTPGANKTINSVTCGTLTTRMMNVTSAGPDSFLTLNSSQKRVLNVALYPYIPNSPAGNFNALLQHVIEAYQTAYPEVLLSVQINQGTNTYDYDNLKTLLGADGLDVIEQDTVYLGYLAENNLINEIQPASLKNSPFQVAIDGSTYAKKLWGVPSWLCMNFVYGTKSTLEGIKTLAALAAALPPNADVKPMAADYNGTWTLPAMYINAYVQKNGYTPSLLDNVLASVNGKDDDDLIDNLVTLTGTCAEGSENKCTNKTYHDSEVAGIKEKAFADGNAYMVMDYSEQSFYIRTYKNNPGFSLYVIPGIWGPKAQPLLFSDSFVSSKANCSADPCLSDALNFSNLMTSAEMKAYIVESKDLANQPWRTLLVASQPFYERAEIKSNALYQRYLTTVLQNTDPSPQSYPNSFSEADLNALDSGICNKLETKQKNYVCH